MPRKPITVYAAMALASLLASAVQSEPLEALLTAEAWSVAPWSGPSSTAPVSTNFTSTAVDR